VNGRLGKITHWETAARAANFDPATLAAICFVSPRQLQRFFKQRFRTTPRQWLRELQCRLGRDLISRGYSTKAAAAELKFATAAHFCREFKKGFGVPPQSFAPGYEERKK
jgi:AraC-like DNA-binding protein